MGEQPRPAVVQQRAQVDARVPVRGEVVHAAFRQDALELRLYVDKMGLCYVYKRWKIFFLYFRLKGRCNFEKNNS